MNNQTYTNTTTLSTTAISGKVLQTVDDMARLHDKNGIEFELESAKTGIADTGQGFVMEFDHYNRALTLPANTANPSRVTFRYTDGRTGSPAVTNVDSLSIPFAQADTAWTAGTASRLRADGTTEAYGVLDTVVYFNTNEDLRKLMNNIMVDQDHNGTTDADINSEVLWNNDGTLRVMNAGNDDDFPISLRVDKITGTKENSTFFNIIKGMQGTAATGGELISGEVYAAFHSASIDIYDTLGSKHTLRMEYRKNDLNEWDFRAILPRPVEIRGAEPEGNIIRGGKVNFDVDGSLVSFTPSSLTFSAGNGSKVLQTFKFNFGALGEFGGLTGFDYPSSTGSVEQDGYAGGELVDVFMDDSGKVIGSFNNGKKLALARVALADFENQEGLNVSGSNLLAESVNSGEAHIGVLGFGGRGTIKAGALEKSNTDLSRSLTQLIVIQRAYQAQTKIINTSDQMLQTLLQIKQ
jgi:flagellar hook protein FlgE